MTVCCDCVDSLVLHNGWWLCDLLCAHVVYIPRVCLSCVCVHVQCMLCVCWVRVCCVLLSGLHVCVVGLVNCVIGLVVVFVCEVDHMLCMCLFRVVHVVPFLYRFGSVHVCVLCVSGVGGMCVPIAWWLTRLTYEL